MEEMSTFITMMGFMIFLVSSMGLYKLWTLPIKGIIDYVVMILLAVCVAIGVMAVSIGSDYFLG